MNQEVKNIKTFLSYKLAQPVLKKRRLIHTARKKTKKEEREVE